MVPELFTARAAALAFSCALPIRLPADPALHPSQSHEEGRACSLDLQRRSHHQDGTPIHTSRHHHRPSPLSSWPRSLYQRQQLLCLPQQHWQLPLRRRLLQPLPLHVQLRQGCQCCGYSARSWLTIRSMVPRFPSRKFASPQRSCQYHNRCRRMKSEKEAQRQQPFQHLGSCTPGLVG